MLKERIALCFCILLFAYGALYGGGNEKARVNALITLLKEKKIPFEERALFSQYGSFTSSIHVFIPADPKQSARKGIFALAVPISTAHPSGVQDDFAFDTALKFIEKAQSGGLALDLLVGFLGDETSTLPDAAFRTTHAGLRDFSSRLSGMGFSSRTALWYLEIEDRPTELRFAKRAREKTPFSLIQRLPALCDTYDVRYNFGTADATGRDIVAITESFEIDTLFVSSSRSFRTNALRQKPLDPATLADLLIDYSNALDPSNTVDTHYLLFSHSFGNTVKTFFLSSGFLIRLLFAAFTFFYALFFVYCSAKSEIVSLRWRTFFSYWWFTFLLFVFLLISVGAVFLILAIPKENPSSARGVFLFVSITAPVIYRVLAAVITRLNLTGKRYLFGYSAVLFGAAFSLYLASCDLGLTPAALIGFLCIVISVNAKNALVSYSFTILYPALIFAFLYPALKEGAFPAEVFLNGQIQGAVLFMAFFLFPALLSVQRASFLRNRHGVKKQFLPIKREKTRRVVSIVLCSMYALLCASFYLFHLFDLSLDIFDKSPPYETVLLKDNDCLHSTYSQTRFLERRIVKVSFFFDTMNSSVHSPPARFAITLENDKADLPPSIYAISFNGDYVPYTENMAHSNRIDLTLGENPPNPLDLTMTLGWDFSGVLTVRSIHLDHSSRKIFVYEKTLSF